ncbi:MAG TPA: hypothetical protein VL523_04360 [Terriglobia bacterium]|nr:hypothetical protein [Terriglobia bacterium]
MAFHSIDTADHPFERLLEWARQHPLTVTTAAVVLLAALVVPHARRAGPPPADFGPDETPLFV